MHRTSISLVRGLAFVPGLGSSLVKLANTVVVGFKAGAILTNATTLSSEVVKSDSKKHFA